MDYLLNTLELWEQEYQRDPHNTAKPNVVIDTITGASAGSIAAAVTLLSAASNRFRSVSSVNEFDAKENLHYYTWVKFGLSEEETIVEKIFATDDIADDQLKSVLNTKFIDELIVDIKKIIADSELRKLPPYISPDIEILMTLSNLRGVPIDLQFSDSKNGAAHSMSYHKAFAHFKYLPTEKDDSTFALDFERETQLGLFLDCARASGAFPIGLKSVAFKDIPKSYIVSNLKDIFGADVMLDPKIEDSYEFLAVDGGMTNNEPIAEAIRILRKRNGKGKIKDRLHELIGEIKLTDEQLEDYFTDDLIEELKRTNPVILIDPFPNNIDCASTENNYNIEEDNVQQILPQLLETLRSQVLFKENDIAALFKDDTSRNMIWPTRYNESGQQLRNPIATGGLNGFAGFFDERFRHHDYMLGKKNCQNFLRYHFSQAADECGWSTEMIDRFSFVDDQCRRRVPLIPDFRITSRDDLNNSGGKGEFLPRLEDATDFPTYPQVDQFDLVNIILKPKIKHRLDRIIAALLNSNRKDFKKIDQHPYPKQETLGSFIWKAIPSGMKNYFIRTQIRNSLLPSVLDFITTRLHRHDLFLDSPNPPNTVVNSEE